ncbi:hypothetical protein DICVIV_12417 [Dictyocaulus viviparus]|uniref:SCP domain-containing protein n=1 Tax=Dictyocaulus viviparus TaxID=29172 RepID=A0A0D8XAK1_DICVI|nr:hypothetical protein DICVIV_12417 [Dictyocaulus viviparus]
MMMCISYTMLLLLLAVVPLHGQIESCGNKTKDAYRRYLLGAHNRVRDVQNPMMMKQDNFTNVGCSLKRCPSSLNTNTIVMVCFYEKPATTTTTATPAEEATTTATVSSSYTSTNKSTTCTMNKKTRERILSSYGNLMKSKTSEKPKWSCELEKMAKETVENCPQKLENTSSASSNSQSTDLNVQVRLSAFFVKKILHQWKKSSITRRKLCHTLAAHLKTALILMTERWLAWHVSMVNLEEVCFCYTNGGTAALNLYY